MKNLIAFITLLIFILNISHNVISAETKDGKARDPVLDMDGNELKTGTNYYLRPDFRPGDGLTVYPLANKTCTYAITQLLVGNGFPVTFSNGGTDPGEVIRESADLTVEFSPRKILCGTAWKVDKYDEATGQYFVIAGEVDGSDTSNKWFDIRKNAPGSYMFYFCPKVCEFCVQVCTNVGIYNGRLALGGHRSYTFRFMKENRSERNDA